MQDWSRRFTQPVPVPNGEPLQTLADARAYIVALPPRIYSLPRWQTAIETLLVTVEHNGPTDFARIGMMQALRPLGERQVHTKRKARKLKIIR